MQRRRGRAPATSARCTLHDGHCATAARPTLALQASQAAQPPTIIVGTLLFFTALGVLAWPAQPLGGWSDRLDRHTMAAFMLARAADAVENLTALDPPPPSAETSTPLPRAANGRLMLAVDIV